MGEDRKNVGLLIKAFYETFKNKMNAPALDSKNISSKLAPLILIEKRYLRKIKLRLEKSS
jgi:hypothetical protein